MGGGDKSSTTQRQIAPNEFQNILGQLQDTSNFGRSRFEQQATQKLLSGELLPSEQQSLEQQLAAIEAGAVGGEQAIQQSIREQSSARGFGGDSASEQSLIQEASRLGQFQQGLAGQRANVFGQAGQLQRQGLTTGLNIEQQRRQQQLQRLLGAGGLASQVLTNTKSSSGGGIGGTIGALGGFALGGPAGAAAGSQIGSSI